MDEKHDEQPYGSTPPDMDILNNTEEIGDSDSDSADEVIEEDIVTEEPAMRARDKRLPSLFYDANGELSAELGEVLFENTYFDRDELHLLYKHFITMAPNNVLSQDQFALHFAPFAKSPLLVKNLFHAMDRNSDGFVQFYEYVTLISSVTRGSKKEKLKMAFEICDLNGDGLVYKSDVLEVVTAASEIFFDMGDDIADHSTPLEVVDSLFGSRLEPTDSSSNVLVSSVRAGLVSTVGLLGVGGVGPTTSESELHSDQIRQTDVFDLAEKARVPSDKSENVMNLSHLNDLKDLNKLDKDISTENIENTTTSTPPTEEKQTTRTTTPPPSITTTTTPPPPSTTTSTTASTTTLIPSTNPLATTPTSTTPNSTTPTSESSSQLNFLNLNGMPRSNSRRSNNDDDKDSEGGKSSKLSLASLSWKDFARVAELDPDLIKCFGMFDYFYYSVVKPIEVTLKTDVVRPGMQGHLLYSSKVKILGNLSSKMSRRFFVISEGFFIQYSHLSKTPHRVTCLIGASVKAVDHMASTGLFRRKKKLSGFILQVGTYRRLFTTSSRAHAKEWVHAVRANAKGGYRYQSFAPVRENNEAQFYVGGKEYYAALAAAIPKANHEIYIAGWWVAPETYLVKKKPLKLRYRLDEMLKERADKGVQIKILVWDETSLGITIGSGHTKSWLENLHKNIHVVKHPKIYPLAWSHHQKMVVIDQQYAFIGGIDLCFMRYDDDEFTLVDFEGEKFPGKDYGNLNVFVKRTGDPMVDQIDRKTIPRLPWHDVTVSVEGLAAADVSVNFIQRWNHSIDSNSEYKHYPHLIPKPIRVTPERNTSIQNLLKDIKDLVTGDEDDMNTPKLPRRRRSRAASLPATKSMGRIHYDEHGNCEAQVVRSVCEWSAGQEAEDSCYKAYMELISKAEKFIYIQNLYFISSTGGDTPKNRIVLAILRRIRRAIQNRETFKVVVITSVYPAGEIELPSTRMLIGWTMKTICRGGKSILELLSAEFPGVNIDDYISFYSLRSWQYHSGVVWTEEIYVHSKVMIVDDRTVIVGSANINDRSMRGTRDSEICIVVRDKEEIESTMAGAPYKVGGFAHELRKRLWALHTGVSMEEVVDPLHPDVFVNIWRNTAIQNSEIFAQVFGTGIPENQRKLEPIVRSKPCDDSTLKLLQKTKGYIVSFPIHFLEDEYLEPSVFNKEWFLKTNVFI